MRRQFSTPSRSERVGLSHWHRIGGCGICGRCDRVLFRPLAEYKTMASNRVSIVGERLGAMERISANQQSKFYHRVPEKDTTSMGWEREKVEKVFLS